MDVCHWYSCSRYYEHPDGLHAQQNRAFLLPGNQRSLLVFTILHCYMMLVLNFVLQLHH